MNNTVKSEKHQDIWTRHLNWVHRAPRAVRCHGSFENINFNAGRETFLSSEKWLLRWKSTHSDPYKIISAKRKAKWNDSLGKTRWQMFPFRWAAADNRSKRFYLHSHATMKKTLTWQLLFIAIFLFNQYSIVHTLHKVISYGAMITSVNVPSKTGEIADVALGFDTIEGMIEKAEIRIDLKCQVHAYTPGKLLVEYNLLILDFTMSISCDFVLLRERKFISKSFRSCRIRHKITEITVHNLGSLSSYL